MALLAELSVPSAYSAGTCVGCCSWPSVPSSGKIECFGSCSYGCAFYWVTANMGSSNTKKPLWMWSIWRLVSYEHCMEKLWMWISSIQEGNRENTAREFTLGFRIAPSMVMFLGSRLKKSWHNWEVGRENKKAHKKSIFYSVTRIFYSKTFSIW